MNKAFKKLAFWNLFTHLERPEITEDQIDAWQDLLSEDYHIERELFNYEQDGQSLSAVNRVIVFDFELGAGYRLELQYTPHAEGGEKYLYLVDKKTEERALMGWWNVENWHPFCLEEQELQDLIAYWSKNDARWENSALALVLLHDFVGFGNNHQADRFAKKVFEAYQTMEIKGFSKAEQKPIAVFVYEDSAYQWKYDAQLGRIFHSEVYACYSIRNAAHATGEEGRFPFEQWKKVMAAIRKH